jgi:hypothetical protein
MKPRKPDRFERMVLKKTYPDMAVDKDDAIKLLRNEHAWMERMVKQVDAWACQELADNDDAIAEILKQLAQRRK